MSRAKRKALLEEELAELKSLLHQLEIPYRETQKIKSPGGLCMVDGQRLCILKKDLVLEKKVEVLREQLRNLDLDDVYLKPRVRELLGLEALEEDTLDGDTLDGDTVEENAPAEEGASA